jgi:hypothetical protein
LPLHAGDANLDAGELIGDRREQALELVGTVRQRWQWLLDNLDLPLTRAEAERTAGTIELDFPLPPGGEGRGEGPHA